MSGAVHEGVNRASWFRLKITVQHRGSMQQNGPALVPVCACGGKGQGNVWVQGRTVLSGWLARWSPTTVSHMFCRQRRHGNHCEITCVAACEMVACFRLSVCLFLYITQITRSCSHTMASSTLQVRFFCMFLHHPHSMGTRACSSCLHGHDGDA